MALEQQPLKYCLQVMGVSLPARRKQFGKSSEKSCRNNQLEGLIARED